MWHCLLAGSEPQNRTARIIAINPRDMLSNMQPRYRMLSGGLRICRMNDRVEPKERSKSAHPSCYICSVNYKTEVIALKGAMACWRQAHCLIMSANACSSVVIYNQIVFLGNYCQLNHLAKPMLRRLWRFRPHNLLVEILSRK